MSFSGRRHPAPNPSLGFDGLPTGENSLHRRAVGGFPYSRALAIMLTVLSMKPARRLAARPAGPQTTPSLAVRRALPYLDKRWGRGKSGSLLTPAHRAVIPFQAGLHHRFDVLNKQVGRRLARAGGGLFDPLGVVLPGSRNVSSSDGLGSPLVLRWSAVAANQWEEPCIDINCFRCAGVPGGADSSRCAYPRALPGQAGGMPAHVVAHRHRRRTPGRGYSRPLPHPGAPQCPWFASGPRSTSRMRHRRAGSGAARWGVVTTVPRYASRMKRRLPSSSLGCRLGGGANAVGGPAIQVDQRGPQQRDVIHRVVGMATDGSVGPDTSHLVQASRGDVALRRNR